MRYVSTKMRQGWGMGNIGTVDGAKWRQVPYTSGQKAPFWPPRERLETTLLHAEFPVSGLPAVRRTGFFGQGSRLASTPRLEPKRSA